MKSTWKNYAITAVISLVTTVVIYPLIKPLLQKIPVIGSYFN
jgi:hypothetical protein